MFLIDDLLMAPMGGLMYVFREIHKAAVGALAEEGDRLRAALSELYLRLESREISDEQFDALEAELLDRLDALEAVGAEAEEEAEAEADDEDEDEAE